MSNRTQFYLYKLYSLLLYCLPLVILFAINHEQYLKNAGTSLSFFGFIIVMFFLIAFKTKFSNIAKKNPLLTFSFVIFILSFIMRFLATQMLLISGSSVLGCLLAYITEQVADVYYNRIYKLNNGQLKKIRTKTLPQKQAWKEAFIGIEEIS